MTPDYNAYRQRETEQARLAALLDMMPRGRRTALDIGTRDGYIARLLTEYYESVTALDLSMPSFEFDRVTTVQGDVTRLEFPDNSFDSVFCLEVLEHLPGVMLEQACSEIARVARHDVVISVPYREDSRIGRTTCIWCGKKNPPWGHVNTFDEQRLRRLFGALAVVKESYIGIRTNRTNAVSTFLLDVAGNPWGTYTQEEHCVGCGKPLVAPGPLPLWRRACAAIAVRINKCQSMVSRPVPIWIQAVFAK